MHGPLLAEARIERSDFSTSPSNGSLKDWPVAGGGQGCTAFLAGLGVEDGLIAFRPTPAEPRAVFVLGLEALRRQPERVRGLVAAAQRFWSPLTDQPLAVVELTTGMLDPDYAEDFGGEPVLAEAWPSPLDPFCQAIVAQQSSPHGKLDLFLLRRRTRGPLNGEALALLKAALPLFLDAVVAFCAARQVEQRSSLVRAMFDHMTMPTLLVDAQSRPLMLNRAAVQLLRKRDVLLASAEGAIVARSLRENRELKEAVARAVGVSHANDDGMEAVRLVDREGQWLLAVVIPARPCLDNEVRSAAMIVVHTPPASGAPPCILSALGLLPSEQRFLDWFLRTDSLAEAAARCTLSQETARTYLKRIRSKLGAHRQMDLARLIYGMMPPVASDRLLTRLEQD